MSDTDSLAWLPERIGRVRTARFADVDALASAFGELEAIVRDLAAAHVDGLGPVMDELRDRCRRWVSAHPVSGDPA